MVFTPSQAGRTVQLYDFPAVFAQRHRFIARIAAQLLYTEAAHWNGHPVQDFGEPMRYGRYFWWGAAAAVALTAAGVAAQEPSPPVQPQVAPAPIEGKPATVEAPKSIHADFQVESTALGFEQGIAPAPGSAVTYRGKLYEVAEVFAADGGPSFSGGSRFVITTEGGRLVVGLISPEGGEKVNVAQAK
jgi:hypothetical protein